MKRLTILLMACALTSTCLAAADAGEGGEVEGKERHALSSELPLTPLSDSPLVKAALDEIQKAEAGAVGHRGMYPQLNAVWHAIYALQAAGKDDDVQKLMEQFGEYQKAQMNFLKNTAKHRVEHMSEGYGFQNADIYNAVQKQWEALAATIRQMLIPQ